MVPKKKSSVFQFNIFIIKIGITQYEYSKPYPKHQENPKAHGCTAGREGLNLTGLVRSSPIGTKQRI